MILTTNSRSEFPSQASVSKYDHCCGQFGKFNLISSWLPFSSKSWIIPASHFNSTKYLSQAPRGLDMSENLGKTDSNWKKKSGHPFSHKKINDLQIKKLHFQDSIPWGLPFFSSYLLLVCLACCLLCSTISELTHRR